MNARNILRQRANDVFRASRPRHGQRRRWVLLVMTTWKVGLEHVDRDIERLSTHLERIWVRRAMHADRMISFVVISEETASQLKARLADEFAKCGLLEVAWVMPASDEIVANRPIDALEHQVHEAWQLVHDHNNPPKRPSQAEIIQRHVRPDGDVAAAVRAGLEKRKTA